jgi:hypothetical protein
MRLNFSFVVQSHSRLFIHSSHNSKNKQFKHTYKLTSQQLHHKHPIMNLSTYLFSTTFALASIAVHGCGMFEFFNWVNLPDEVKAAATGLGYTDSSWAKIKTNPIEYLRFSELLNATQVETPVGVFEPTMSDFTGALMELDLFDKDGLCWDFYINHYDGYTWEELESTFTPFGENVQDLVMVLGWDETMWSDKEFTGPVPASECQFWITLTPEHKWANRALGWDGLAFSDAPCDPRCPKSLVCPFNE